MNITRRQALRLGVAAGAATLGDMLVPMSVWARDSSTLRSVFGQKTTLRIPLTKDADGERKQVSIRCPSGGFRIPRSIEGAYGRRNYSHWIFLDRQGSQAVGVLGEVATMPIKRSAYVASRRDVAEQASKLFAGTAVGSRPPSRLTFRTDKNNPTSGAVSIDELKADPTRNGVRRQQSRTLFFDDGQAVWVVWIASRTPSSFSDRVRSRVQITKFKEPKDHKAQDVGFYHTHIDTDEPGTRPTAEYFTLRVPAHFVDHSDTHRDATFLLGDDAAIRVRFFSGGDIDANRSRHLARARERESCRYPELMEVGKGNARHPALRYVIEADKGKSVVHDIYQRGAHAHMNVTHIRRLSMTDPLDATVARELFRAQEPELSKLAERLGHHVHKLQ